MLLFPLAAANRYLDFHPGFRPAFSWLAGADRMTTPTGRQVIDGDRLFAIVEEGTGHDPVTRRFESHRRYLDIQVNLAGGEAMAWTPVSGLVVEDDFAPGGDIAYYARTDRQVTLLTVAPHHAAVFLPEDAHMPSLRLGLPAQTFRKIVFKVLVDWV